MIYRLKWGNETRAVFLLSGMRTCKHVINGLFIALTHMYYAQGQGSFLTT